jgi:hypothetical protein
MPAQRLIGQNVSIIIIQDSAPIEEVTCVKSFNFTYELELKSEGYLGEYTERKDSVFKGVKMDMELHTNNHRILGVVKTAVDKAKRRTPGVRINIKASMTWPNGDVARITFPDVEFGAFPFSVGSRTDYVSVKVEAACSDALAVLT